MTTILVTGATGTVGAKVLAALAARGGLEVRAAVRPSSAARAVSAAGAAPVPFDFESEASMREALLGVDRLFLLAPALRDQVGASNRLVDLAREAGVARVVKLSALDCDVEPTIAWGRAHHAVERHVQASGMAWTFLRPNDFMDNFLGLRHGAFAPDREGNIRIPWGDAACSFVAAADIARVAAAALAGDGLEGQTLDLTGPEAVTMADAARMLSEETGRPVHYVDVAPEEARRAMLALGMPSPAVEGTLELHALGRAGRAARVTDAVERVTGRAPTTFRAFARASRQGGAS